MSLFPFVTIDVFLVAMAFAMPLSVQVAAHVSGRLTDSLAWFAGFGLVGLSIAVLAALNLPGNRGAWETSAISATTLGGGAVLRVALAILLSVGGMLVGIRLTKGKLASLLAHIARRSTGAAMLTSAVAAVLMPLVFVHARCQSGWRRFEELRESSRMGEARSELSTVLRLAPHSGWRGRSVAECFREVQADCDRIEQARQQVPHPPTRSEDALRQARFLAILGETDLALGYLEQFPEASESVGAALLRGTIWESRQAWLEAIAEYVLGQERLRDGGESPDASQDWQTALRGEGFCRRKAGDLPGAEKAYLELMRSAPTGDHAMLLAYFYEDTQQTRLAERWLREAVRLEPAYGDEAARLASKLSTSHFGCLGVYRQRVSQPVPLPR